MIMDHEVKFNEGENSLRKKKTFLNKQGKHAWLKKSGYGSYRPFPIVVVVFFFVKTAYTYALKFVRMPNLNLIG